MVRYPDNYDAFWEHERKAQLEEYQWPKCCMCEAPIPPGQGFECDGEFLHKGECLSQFVREAVLDDEVEEFYAEQKWGLREI